MGIGKPRADGKGKRSWLGWVIYRRMVWKKSDLKFRYVTAREIQICHSERGTDDDTKRKTREGNKAGRIEGI